MVAWKQGVPRLNVSYECLSSSPTLLYTIIKKKEFFCDAKVDKGPEASECPEAPLG